MAKAARSDTKEGLLEHKLRELTLLVKELNSDSRIEISFEQHEDEDAHVRIYPPAGLSPDEVQRLELMLGQRCTDILRETGLFILSAVYDSPGMTVRYPPYRAGLSLAMKAWKFAPSVANGSSLLRTGVTPSADEGARNQRHGTAEQGKAPCDQ